MPGTGPNCILAVCCPPNSEGQIDALAQEINAAFPGRLGGAWCHEIAAWILKNYDLAPAGSLQAFKDAIRGHAREGYVKVE